MQCPEERMDVLPIKRKVHRSFLDTVRAFKLLAAMPCGQMAISEPIASCKVVKGVSAI